MSLIQYVAAYSELSEYGKGFFWGNSLILILGVILIYLGVRKRKVLNN